MNSPVPISTLSFVLTLPLRVAPTQERMLRVRFEAARSCYNALLGECLRRSRLMRESRAWRAIGKMPKGKEKTAAYRALNVKYGFREYDLYPFIQRQRKHPGIGLHIDSHTCQALAARAFAAVERSIFTRGRARFRRRGEWRSVEGVSANSPLRWKGEAIVWSGLALPAIIDTTDPVVRHGLESRVRLSRIVRMTIRGRERYYAQLVCEGEAYKKPQHKPGSGIVGLDIGPSTIAVVAAKSASLETFCTELENRRHAIAQLQRQESRSRYLNNRDNFHPGTKTIKKGAHNWHHSKRSRKAARRRAELERREREHRKNLHGRLAHKVLSLGDDVRTEKLSYRSFQRRFGKSVRTRAPGMFVAKLKAEAVKRNATVTEFSTNRTMLSQTCICGQLRRKSLSERTHDCGCGVNAQRDLLSAYLATHVVDGRLDAAGARKGWRRACNLLRAASGVTNDTTGGPAGLAHGAGQRRRSESHADASRKSVSASDAVAGRKAQARAGEKPVERMPRKMIRPPHHQTTFW